MGQTRLFGLFLVRGHEAIEDSANLGGPSRFERITQGTLQKLSAVLTCSIILLNKKKVLAIEYRIMERVFELQLIKHAFKNNKISL